MKRVPPSILIILDKIQEHIECIERCTCDAQRLCHELVILELEDILDKLRDIDKE